MLGVVAIALTEAVSDTFRRLLETAEQSSAMETVICSDPPTDGKSGTNKGAASPATDVAKKIGCKSLLDVGSVAEVTKARASLASETGAPRPADAWASDTAA